MFKQNNIIRYFVAISAFLVITGPLVQNGWCDFILFDNEQRVVTGSDYKGTLYDTSSASIISGGELIYLYAYDYSTVDISGTFASVYHLYANNSSTVNIFNAWYMDDLYAYDLSTVNMYDGRVYSLSAYNSSTINISGGFAHDYLVAYNSSTVNISGGSLGSLETQDSSTVNISGGSITHLQAGDLSVVTFYGSDFLAGSGLSFNGNRILGNGTLSGKWMDGTPWSIYIQQITPTVTLLVTPEPATLLLFGLGAIITRTRKK